ncbi:hypothetical protein [Arthrobacter sp. zg-Y238]|uniref:hypothetical protein n=1 Tax=Arthrobacter sp. zg-Y238 TaxID=2964614 RepID=UPI00210301C5|nr:hypothetical protein [Arthrobacter sp. zg-Y238]MCQ1953020.1 hypothetical protein [Arthrobacter sp. zg-Y238]
MTHAQGPRPSPDEARQALESITLSKQALAPHVRSPAWLYPAQAVGMAMFVIGLVFSKEADWATGLFAVSGILFCVLPMLQSRGRVVVDVYTHPGSRGLSWTYVAVFLLICVAAVVLYSTYSRAWIAYVAAVLVLVLTLVAGPAMDARLERALRNAG